MNHLTYMTQFDNMIFYLSYLKKYVLYMGHEAERIEANEKIKMLIENLNLTIQEIEKEIQNELEKG